MIISHLISIGIFRGYKLVVTNQACHFFTVLPLFKITAQFITSLYKFYASISSLSSVELQNESEGMQ